MSMNKIFSWTIGSFFRTIGRIIAYIAIGLLIAFILSNSKLPKISNTLSDIFFMKVDALALDGVLTQEINIRNEDMKVRLYDNGLTRVLEQSFPFSTNFKANGNNYAVFSISGLEYYRTDNNSNFIYDSFIKVYLESSGSWAMCEVQNNAITCGLSQVETYHGLHVWIDPGLVSAADNWHINLTINQNVSLYKTQAQTIIENQQSNTQSIIDNQQSSTNRTIEALTDSNTTSTEGEASSFFSNFSTSDNGGLSSIITAPLSAIQSLTNASCSPLVLPLPYINENLTLPCMRTIYQTHFGAFMVLYDTITLGIISYWILVRIFNMVKDFKNPDHDEIEVVDL